MSADQAVHTVLVMVPHYWGRGDTLREAKAEVFAQGGTFAGGWIAYHFGDGFVPGEAWVDPMGTLRWEWTAEAAALPNTARPQPRVEDHAKR